MLSRRLIGISHLFFAVGAAFAAETNPYASLKPGQWLELPDTAMREVFPKESGHPAWGTIGPRGVVAAWGGAAFDQKQHKLYLTGGGHSDYGGNEVYEFNLETLRWSRLTEPSAMAKGLRQGEYVTVDSEAPVSSHTYDGLVFLPIQKKMFKFGGSYYGNGSPYDRNAYLFDPLSKIWKRGSEAPTYVLQVNSDFDPRTGQVIVGTGSGLMSYDPNADEWKLYPQYDSAIAAATGVFDPERNIFVQTIASAKEVHFYSLESRSKRQKAPIVGDVDWPNRSGMAYHSPSKRFVLWGGGRSTWVFNSRDWRVQKYENPSGDAPTPLRSNGDFKSAGIYGRWQYVEDYDVFIAYNHTGDNVWLYKLPSADYKEIVRPCGADICVGPGRKHGKPSEAAFAAKDGDVVLIDAGNYVGDAATWPQSNLTIRAVGGRAHIDARGVQVGGKGTWIIKGHNVLIENIEFSGAKVPDRNGAGIRLEGKNLSIRNCYFHHNENGILTGVNEESDIVIEHSEFAHNGFGDGQSHNIYVGRVRSLTVRYSSLHHANVGHNLKSRALSNYIFYNSLIDEKSGMASYEINLPDGGLAYLMGNIIQQSPRTENNTIVSYGEEGLKKNAHEFYFVNNTVINDASKDSRFIRLQNGTQTAKIVNNVFAGPGKLLEGVGEMRNNYVAEKSEFVAYERNNYRLRPGSGAIDAAVDAGQANGVRLLPTNQYGAPLQAIPRQTIRRLDIGAFEH